MLATLWWTNILLWKDPPCLMGTSTISTGPFSIAMLVHQRVIIYFGLYWRFIKVYGSMIFCFPIGIIPWTCQGKWLPNSLFFFCVIQHIAARGTYILNICLAMPSHVFWSSTRIGVVGKVIYNQLGVNSLCPTKSLNITLRSPIHIVDIWTEYVMRMSSSLKVFGHHAFLATDAVSQTLGWTVAIALWSFSSISKSSFPKLVANLSWFVSPIWKTTTSGIY